MVSVEFHLPATWVHQAPPGGVVMCLQRETATTGTVGRVTVTARPGVASSGAAEPAVLARALDGFRLIDQGTFDGSHGRGDWLVGYYLARGLTPVTLHSWWFGVGDHVVTVVATVPCTEYDEVADELGFAVELMTLEVS